MKDVFLAEMPAPVKEYNDVLVLSRSVIKDTIASQADGFQFSDILTVLQVNLDKAMMAYTGGDQIVVAWKEYLRECAVLTAHFLVDAACDVLKLGDPSTDSEFAETDELLAAVSGIIASIMDRIPGGFQASEILPVLMENFQKLLVGIEGVDKIGAEMKADIRAFLHVVVGFAVATVFDVRDIVTSGNAEAEKVEAE